MNLLVTATPAELRPGLGAVIDVYAALERRFFWADTVMVGLDDGDLAEDELEVLEGEVVASPPGCCSSGARSGGCERGTRAATRFARAATAHEHGHDRDRSRS
jgi:hypothetical protein